MNISDILKAKGNTVKTIKRSDTIGHLSNLLKKERMGAMVVSEDGKALDGIISERDIAYGLSERRGDLHLLKVSSLMATDVITCSSNASLNEAATLMAKNHIRHLPVVDNGRISGLVSMRDVVEFRLTNLASRTDGLKKLVAMQ